MNSETNSKIQTSIHVLVGSKNPVKINCTKVSFLKYYENVTVEGVEVESGVPDQPVDEETFLGAHNRAKHLFDINTKNSLGGDYFVGLEGGVTKQFNKWFELGCFCIINKDGKEAFGSSPMFELPESFIKRIIEDKVELGTVIDEFTGQKNLKQQGGAIAILSKNVMGRQELYESGLICTIIPFLNDELYFKK